MPKESMPEAAAPADPPAPQERDDRETFVVRLQPRHALYLRQRAAMFGQTPEDHLEGILRQFRSHHDMHRPEHQPRDHGPGEPAVTMRAR
jgi:hypothetical protein